MAQTLASLRQLLADATQAHRNARGIDPLESDMNAQINWAYRVIASKCYLVGYSPLTLQENHSTYNVTDLSCTQVKFKVPLKVFIASSTSPSVVTPLWNAARRNHNLWKIDELDKFYPSRLSDPVGIPFAAARLNWDQIVIYPTPDANTAAQSGHQIYGIYLPADMISDSDQPDLPESVHEAIAWLAAELALTPTMTEDQGWKRIQEYKQYWSGLIQEIADQNARNMSSIGSTSGPGFDDYMLM